MRAFQSQILSRWSLVGVTLAFLMIASMSAAAAADEPLVDSGLTIELQVVGPDHKPVPHAAVELRTRPVPKAEQIERGTFVRGTNYGAFLKTDDSGKLVVRFPAKPKRLEFDITNPGYAPYWAAWSSNAHAEPIPAAFTAELDAAWSVGGMIVDHEGKLVEGVKIHPNIKFKKRPGDTGELYLGAARTSAADGTWRFDSVPASQSEVFVEISHPDFRPNRRSLTRGEFGLAAGEQPSQPIEMDPGLIVTGLVTNAEGQPVAGARIRTKFLNDIREAKTDADGHYRLAGCEPKTARIVVSAKGLATDMREVRVAPDLPPVDFRLQPGGTVRVRVLDEQGNPVPKARIFFQRWRGDFFEYFEFDHVSQYADDHGVWQWNEAPRDVFLADICRPEGMQLAKQSLIAREEEYVFRVPPALVISGTVTDAETHKPITAFRVVPGIRSSETHMNWSRGESFAAADGEYRFRRTHDYFAHLIRIEADGYLPAVSRDIQSDEGNVHIDFELQRGKDVTAIVQTPDGKPAVGAKIALGVAGSQISVKNGDLDDGSTYAARRDTDKAGRFLFPPQETDFQLVITHPSGYAYVKAEPNSLPETITLTAWARVEGTFRVGPEPLSNVPITLSSDLVHSYGPEVPSVFTHHDVTTGKDGRFVFERVFPGRGRIGRRLWLMVKDGATEVTSSAMIPAEFPAGETTPIDLGGSGRAVIGRLKPPQGVPAPVLWNFALVHVQPGVTPPPPPDIPANVQGDREKLGAWRAQWLLTDEGRAWMAANAAYESTLAGSPYFTATVDRDGSFRIDDVPAGQYVLSVRFSEHAAGKLSNHRFAVPPAEQAPLERPLDLGLLTLE